MNEPMKTNFSQGIFDISVTKKEILGCLRMDKYGNLYRYAKAGAAALCAGKMGQAIALTANHLKCVNATIATAVGKTEVAVTVGATAVTANQYEDGTLQVTKVTTAALGNSYHILGNTACDASGVTYVTLDEPIKVALVAATEVSLISNMFGGTVATDTEEAVAVGISRVAVTATYYYWSQTGGEACALITGTPAVGTKLIMGAVTGALGAMTTVVDIDQPIVALKWGGTAVDAEYEPVKLLID